MSESAPSDDLGNVSWFLFIALTGSSVEAEMHQVESLTSWRETARPLTLLDRLLCRIKSKYATLGRMESQRQH